jgi:hypothetical protein
MMRMSAMPVEHSEGAAMTLDFAVSRAVTQSRLLERALHSRAPWSISIGEISSAATRFQHDNGVDFTAFFTDVSPDINMVALFEGETLLSVKPFRYPGSGRFCLKWDISLEERVSA